LIGNQLGRLYRHFGANSDSAAWFLICTSLISQQFFSAMLYSDFRDTQSTSQLVQSLAAILLARYPSCFLHLSVVDDVSSILLMWIVERIVESTPKCRCILSFIGIISLCKRCRCIVFLPNSPYLLLLPAVIARILICISNIDYPFQITHLCPLTFK
jgi:hypothetical protein